MKSIKQRFSISYAYDVLFTEHLFAVDNLMLVQAMTDAETSSVGAIFVVDEEVANHHPGLMDDIARYFDHHKDKIHLKADALVLPGGEPVKNDPAFVQAIQRAVYDCKIDRHSYVIAIGGGAVLDMAGYAAATSHRGVRHIRIPTTVLAQNDSGVGVKNSVNAFGSKNFLGTFAPPEAVINDFTFLRTLDDRDWRAGISEAVKVALLKDPDFFSFIHANASLLSPEVRDEPAMKHLIHRCAQLHVSHISAYGDPFEKGSSRPLDFGHWAAHRLEALTHHTLRHGEAVAIGISLDCYYAHLFGLLAAEELELILQTFEAVGFKLYVPELESCISMPEHPQSLFRGLEEFREHLGGRLTVMLLEGIGKSREVHEVDYEVYRAAIAKLAERHSVVLR